MAPDLRSILLLSPHPDDIALSLGGWLAWVQCNRPSLFDDIEIFTGFTWSKCAPHVPDADGDAVRVTTLRQAEEESFCRKLGVMLTTGRLPDTSVLNIDMLEPVDLDTDQRLEYLLELLDGRIAGRLVFAPVSLGDHVDHRIVAEAARRSADLARVTVYYEDLPYAGRYDDFERLSIIKSKLGEKALPFYCELDASMRDTKRANLRCYPSQLNDKDIDAVMAYTPAGTDTIRERVWVIDPARDQIEDLQAIGFVWGASMPAFG